MIKKILVPVDGSEITEEIVKYACWLANKVEAPITILNVVSLPYIEPQLVNVEPLLIRSDKILEWARKIAKENGCEVTTQVRTAVGNAGNEIVRFIDDGGFSLVIMGAVSHTMASHLLGSISDRVLHNARCPVLIIRKS